MERIDQNPTDTSNQSILQKLLKVNKNVAVVMSLDIIGAGVDTVSRAFTEKFTTNSMTYR